MLNIRWTPMLSTFGAALLISSCAAEAPAVDSAAEDPASSPTIETVAGTGDTEIQDGPDAAESGGTENDAVHRGGQQLVIGPDDVEFLTVSAEDDDGTEVFHLDCRDDDALAVKAEHNDGAQPVGWPQEWDGSSAMPDPLCHPDYLEIEEWEDLEAHTACWEGIETSTLVRGGQSQEEVDRDLWRQSQARADWKQSPSGGTCAEQWAENDGGDPEDYDDVANANDD